MRGSGPHRAEKGRKAFHRGHGAERRAAWLLRLKGYRILAINWRSVAGEIDLVARRGRCVAFVEVKQRADHEAAAFALRRPQSRRLERAATLFLAQHPELGACDVRFDLIAFARLGLPVHVKDAWRPEAASA